MKLIDRYLSICLCAGFIAAGITSVWAQGSTPESVLRRAQGLLEAYKAASEQPEQAPCIVGDSRAYKQAATVIFSDTFESGSANWTADEGSEWEIGAPTFASGPSAHGGSKVAGLNLDGPYASQYSSLTSKQIVLSGGHDVVRAEFYLWYELYYDYLYAEVSTDGTNWTNILSSEQVPYGYIYDYVGDTSYYQRYIRKSWNKVTCDLTSYAGQTVQVRFRIYGYYGGGYYNEAGVYIDDFSITGYERGNPIVMTMPPYYTWPGAEAVIWGAVEPDNGIGDFAGASYSWDFGDDSAAETGTVTDSNFIITRHTYMTAGTKTATLTVDVTGAEKRTSFTKTATINVLIDNTETRRLQAIEDGLRYLYTEARTNGQIGQGTHIMAETGLAVLAFEEQGHYASNDPDEDIYAPVVERGLEFIIHNAQKFVFADKTATYHPGEPDTNLNGFGMYLGLYDYNAKYETGVNLLTVVASRTPNEVITDGVAAGMTYKELVQDVIDYFAFTQADTTSTYRGGWRYNSYYDGQSDNSCAQWPALGMLAAEQEWGCYIPTWMRTENLKWLQNSQGSDGGFGYTWSGDWVNLAKTGAGMCQYAFQKVTAENEAVQLALEYLANHWGDRNSYDGQFNESFYTLYAITKGCRLVRYQNGDQINTIGGHNWWEEYVDFLVSDQTYGQNENGKWYDEYWSSGSEYTLSTSLSILVLSPGVFELPPVAVITGPEGAQPNTDVQFSGANSYHQDAQKSIVEWIWDFDKSDGIDWNNPDAVGQSVVKLGGWSVTADIDTFYVTLRVKDNSTPEMYDTEEHTIIISRGLNHAPVADAGGPYTGQPGVPIQLDATGSYDPDTGDSITRYEWDLDGNGEYNDSTDPSPTITWNDVQEGLVGVRVYDSEGLSSSAETPVYVSIWTSEVDLDISEGGFVISNNSPNAGETITLSVSGVYLTDGSETLDRLLIRFYNGNPDSSFTVIADETVEAIGPGQTFSAQAAWTVPVDRKATVWVKLDADERIKEYDESNNAAEIFIGGETGVREVMLYFDPDPARILGSGQVPTDVSLLVSNVTDLFGANIVLSFDASKVNVISMTPGEFFSTGAGQISDLSSFNNTAGSIDLQLVRMGGNLAGATGSGSIIDIKFTGTGTDPTSDLVFESYYLVDSVNNPISVSSADDGAFIGISSLLADFDNNMTVDFADYTQFIVYWNADNMSGDIVSAPGAPNTAGSPPWSKDGYPYEPDGAINFQDQVVFAIMYNWYLSVTSESAAKLVSFEKPLLTVVQPGLSGVKNDYVIGDTFVVSMNPGYVENFLGAEIVLTYDRNVLRIKSIKAGQAFERYGLDSTVLVKTTRDRLTASTVALSGSAKGVDLYSESLFNIEFEVIGEGMFIISLANCDLRNYANASIPIRIVNTTFAGVVGKVAESIQPVFSLEQNFPNPFNMSTTIPYALDHTGSVEICIYNSLGQRIRTLISGVREPGSFAVTWDGTDDTGNAVTSGVYFARLKQGARSVNRQLLLIK